MHHSYAYHALSGRNCWTRRHSCSRLAVASPLRERGRPAANPLRLDARHALRVRFHGVGYVCSGCGGSGNSSKIGSSKSSPSNITAPLVRTTALFPPRTRAPRSSSAAAAAGPRGDAAEASSAPSRLSYSSETTRALRAAKEQAVRQGIMFAGPDQLLLGVLAAASGGGGGGASGNRGSGGNCSAAAALEAALGGGDVDSVREWLNEQTGVVAPLVYGGGGGSVSSGTLRPSDVEFAAAAREALRLAEDGAEAMGSSSVGTYHLLLVLMQAGARAAQRTTGGGAADPGTEASESAAEGGAEQASRRQSGSGGSGGGTAEAAGSVGGGVVGLLPALLRVAKADTASLGRELMALAERGAEPPPAVVALAAYQDVVTHLRGTYQQLSSRPFHERDDAAFRAAPPQSGGRGYAGQADDDDVYE